MSVAAIVTTAVPPGLFSATLAVVGWFVNAGAFGATGGSSTSVTLIVTSWVAVFVPSLAVTVAV